MMVDWVQNTILISQGSDDPLLINEVRIFLEKIHDREWMADNGFRVDDTFDIEKNKNGFKILADTKFVAPINLYEEWAKQGLVFLVYYCDVFNWSFFGKWDSAGIHTHFRIRNPLEPSKLDAILKQIPEDFRMFCDIDYHLRNPGE